MSNQSKETGSGPALAGGLAGLGVEALATANGLPTYGVLGIVGSIFGERGFRALARERRRRVSVALGVAEKVSGRSREELDDLIASDPAAVSLVLQFLQAAGNAGEESVLKLIGSVAGMGIRDISSAERQSTVLLSLEGLTAAHVRMLVVLDREHIPEGHRHEADVVADWLSESADVVRMLGTGLLLRGLVENPYSGFGGGEAYSLSLLGMDVVKTAQILEDGV